MPIKAIIPVLTLVILLISCTACCVGAKLVPNGMTADALTEAAIAAEGGVDTYQFDGVVSMTVEGQTLSVDVTGIVDEQNREIYISMGSSEQIGNTELYIVDGWVYMKTIGPNMTATWNKTPLTNDIWQQRNLPQQQIATLNDLTQADYLSTEAVGTTECYKLGIIPELEKMVIWVMGEEGLENMAPATDLEEIFSDYSMSVWITADTYHIIKTSIEATIVADLEFMIVTMTQSITLSRSHFNEPVSIELPQEAEGATVVTSP
jgi:hypothetical protein